MAMMVSIPVVCMAADDVTVLKSGTDRDSYAIGADLARNLKRQGVVVETGPLLQGVRDVLAGDKTLMTEDEIRDTLRVYQNELKKKRLQARGGTAALAEGNREDGIEFLTKNKTKEGVVTTPSGLQYKILKAGDGPKPTAGDTIEYKFRGRLLDGTEFNSSERGGKPATIKVGEGVAGQKEALPLMPVGSKWELYIPSDLAYGEKGVMGSKNRYQIPPNATLILEVELLAIQAAPTQTEPASSNTAPDNPEKPTSTGE